MAKTMLMDVPDTLRANHPEIASLYDRMNLLLGMIEMQSDTIARQQETIGSASRTHDVMQERISRLQAENAMLRARLSARAA